MKNNKLQFNFGSHLEEDWELVTKQDYFPVMQLLEDTYHDSLQWLLDMCSLAGVGTEWVLIDCLTITDKIGRISNQNTAAIMTRQGKNGEMISYGEIICKYHNHQCTVSEALAIAVIYGIELWLVFEEEEVKILEEKK